MKAAVWSWLLVGVVLCATVPAGAQTPVGALAIDERQGDQYGWAVYYETPAAARASGAQRVRLRVFGGADVQPLRCVCGR